MMSIAQIPETWLLRASIPANQAINSVLVGQVMRDPLVGWLFELQANIKETIVLDDIYLRASGDAGTDGIFILEVDGVPVLRTPPASALLVSNPQRPRPLTKRRIVIPKGSRLTVKFVNIVAGGASATTTTLYLDVLVFREP